MFYRSSFSAAFIALAFFLSISTAGYAQQRTKIEAELSGSTLTTGTAKFENRGNRQKFSVEVEDARANTRYRVDVRSSTGLVFRAVMTTNPLGGFDLNRDTELGQPVPSISRGNSVIVFDTVARRVILRGRF